MRGACGLRPRSRRLDVSRRRGVSAAAGVKPRLLGARAQRGEGTVVALSERAAAAGGMPVERDLFDVDDNLLSAQLRDSLEALYDLFVEAPVLGSLIAPRALEATLYQRDFESVRALFAAVIEQERTTDEQIERAVTAQGMARAAELLTSRYTLVITNVPYLARGKQGERLRAFCELQYPAAKNDLATVFLERCLGLCMEGGTASLVLPQNWLFLTSYRKLREKLLKTEMWHLLARLGEGGFETSAAGVICCPARLEPLQTHNGGPGHDIRLGCLRVPHRQ